MYALETFLPLKPVDLLLLLALAQGERHGYALAADIEARTSGTVRLEPGNLYRVIKRLLADGLVVEGERRSAADVGEARRRYYAITSLGRQVAAAEARRLQRLLVSPAMIRLIEEGGVA